MMDDLISRQAAIDEVHNEFDECLVWDESGKCTANEVERILESLPSAQQEIIRCKDCKHLFEDNKCPLRTWWTHTEDDFCSYAERRE